MSKEQEVKRLPKHAIKVGVPFGHPIFDAGGHLLMPAGVVIESESQLEKLYERGLYLDLKTSQALFGDRSDKSGFVSDAAKTVDSKPQGEERVELKLKKLKLGEMLQISPLADETGATKYSVRLIGGLDKKSLICTIPTVDEKLVYIKESTGFSVHMFSGKDVYRFNTMVDAVVNRPYPHMHLKFPREVYCNSLRKNTRVAVSVIASVENKSSLPGDAAKGAGRIVDLSLGGCMLESFAKLFKVGDSIECSFKLPIEEGELLFVLPGIVRNIAEQKSPEGKIMYRHGVQFMEIKLQDRIVLQSFIFEALTGEKLQEI